MDEKELKKKLNKTQYGIMREGKREAEFTGKHWDNDADGIYHCAACGSPVFSSKEKFDSGEGWPTFHKPIDEKNLEFKKEGEKIAVRCKTCHSNLGHAVDGQSPYYRLHSASLDFRGSEETDIELPEFERKEEEEKRESPRDESANSMSTLSMVAAGALAGAVLGAGGAYLYCSNTCVSATNPLQATTTAPRSTSTNPIGTPRSTTITPASTSEKATSSSATSSSALPSSGGGADGTTP